MRENAKTLDQTITTARQQRGNMDAVQRLELREQFAKVRVDNDARFLAAFKPLYASLSPEQQQMANQLVAAHHHWAPSGLTPLDVRAPGRRGQGSIQCPSFCAHTLPNPQQRFDGCRQIRECGHFKELEHAGCETVTVYRPNLEAVEFVF